MCAATAAVLMGLGTVSAMAAVSNVSIKTDTKSLSYTYVIDGDEVSAKSIKTLFEGIDTATSEITQKNLEITSKTDEKDPIYLRLRLVVDNVTSDTDYSPLDYYIFTVKDESGDVLYTTEDELLSSPTALEKDIPLGVFNTSYDLDSRDLIIEYSVNEEVEPNVNPEDVSGMDIMLVTGIYSENDNVPEAMLPVTLIPNATAAPEAVTAAPEQESEQPTEAPTEIPQETEKPKEKKVICGEDIDPGRYVVTGNANVKITTADGDIISETTVTDSEDGSIKGVKQFITSIENGDVITITPISEDIKAVVNFDKTNSGTKSTTAASSTSSTSAPRSTTRPASSSSSSTSSKSTSKSNPKTGDDSLATISLISIMCLSGGAVGVLEVVKRKKVAH